MIMYVYICMYVCMCVGTCTYVYSNLVHININYSLTYTPLQ